MPPKYFDVYRFAFDVSGASIADKELLNIIDVGERGESWQRYAALMIMLQHLILNLILNYTYSLWISKVAKDKSKS